MCGLEFAERGHVEGEENGHRRMNHSIVRTALKCLNIIKGFKDTMKLPDKHLLNANIVVGNVVAVTFQFTSLKQAYQDTDDEGKYMNIHTFKIKCNTESNFLDYASLLMSVTS